MKKVLILICLLTLSLSVYSQQKTDKNGFTSNEAGIDYLILEMKLGAILGGYKNGKFVDAKTAAKGLKVGEDYTLYGLNVGKNEGILKVTKKYDGMDDICPEYVGVETDSKAKSGVALSSNARWNATPRIPKVINPRSRVYRSIVRNFLRSKGIKRPNVQIKKILKVDLEGDGQDEVIIHASNRKDRPGFETKVGGYSFVLLRKIVNGKVRNILMDGDIISRKIEDTIPYNYELSSILDLDADGKMEIVVYGGYYEGSWAVAYKIENGKKMKILETGCGV